MINMLYTPFRRTVHLAFRAILETQNTVRLIGIFGIFTNSTFNRNTGHLGKSSSKFLKYRSYKYKWTQILKNIEAT